MVRLIWLQVFNFLVSYGADGDASLFYLLCNHMGISLPFYLYNNVYG